MNFTFRDLFIDASDPYSPAVLVRLIKERSVESGEQPAVVILEMLKEMDETEKNLWAIGLFEVALSAAVRRAHKEMGVLYGPTRRGGIQHSRSTALFNKPSWRDQLRNKPGSVWDYVLPVGATGQVKRLGDWNQADVLEVAKWYGGMADRLHYREYAFIRLSKRLPNAEITIEEAIADNVIFPSDVRLLKERVTDFEAGSAEIEGVAPTLETLEGEEGYEEVQPEEESEELAEVVSL